MLKDDEEAEGFVVYSRGLTELKCGCLRVRAGWGGSRAMCGYVARGRVVFGFCRFVTSASSSVDTSGAHVVRYPRKTSKIC